MMGENEERGLEALDVVHRGDVDGQGALVIRRQLEDPARDGVRIFEAKTRIELFCNSQQHIGVCEADAKLLCQALTSRCTCSSLLQALFWETKDIEMLEHVKVAGSFVTIDSISLRAVLKVLNEVPESIDRHAIAVKQCREGIKVLDIQADRAHKVFARFVDVIETQINQASEMAS